MLGTRRALLWAGVPLFLILVVACVLTFPGWLYPRLSARSLQSVSKVEDRIRLQNERLKLQNDARTALLQGIGGLLVLVGAGISLRQLSVSREGQVTERFTRAIDQLGHEKSLDVRMGGIYALERIVRNSEQDLVAVIQVLSAYVRGHAPWPSDSRPDTPVDEVPPLQVRAPDVQAAMNVLGRLPRPKKSTLHERLTSLFQLRNVDLRRANLAGLNLSSVDLADSNLEGAMLFAVQFEDADLSDTNLSGANLGGAVHFNNAVLSGANFEGADLSVARFKGATLIGTNFSHANLVFADFRGAKYLEPQLVKGATVNTQTTWPDGFNMSLANVTYKN